jgi:hypothetical protein
MDEHEHDWQASFEQLMEHDDAPFFVWSEKPGAGTPIVRRIGAPCARPDKCSRPQILARKGCTHRYEDRCRKARDGERQLG